MKLILSLNCNHYGHQTNSAPLSLNQKKKKLVLSCFQMLSVYSFCWLFLLTKFQPNDRGWDDQWRIGNNRKLSQEFKAFLDHCLSQSNTADRNERRKKKFFIKLFLKLKRNTSKSQEVSKLSTPFCRNHCRWIWIVFIHFYLTLFFSSLQTFKLN